MEPKDYVVAEISGEYATLREIGGDGTVFVALALLPEGADLGTRLHSEWCQYTLAE